MEQLYIGQKIDLYKVLKTGGYAGGAFTIGTIRPVVEVSECGEPKLLSNRRGSLLMNTSVAQEAKKIGAFIIKRLKNQ